MNLHRCRTGFVSPARAVVSKGEEILQEEKGEKYYNNWKGHFRPMIRLSIENHSTYCMMVLHSLTAQLKLGCSLRNKMTSGVKSHTAKETTQFVVLVRNRLVGAVSPFLYGLKSHHQLNTAASDEGECAEH